jgi:cysteine desulfurase
MFKHSPIYFDNNASTQLDRRVFDTMLPFFFDQYANPHSAHHFGNEINKAVDQARKQVADLIKADKNEIIFTSGSTEAINIVLKGVAESNIHRGRHIVTVSTEHYAVLDTCKHLEEKGFDITYLDVNNAGLLDLNELQASLRPETILVCIMYVNNETGVIQPIKEVASIVSKTNALLFTDATQAAGKLDINVVDLAVDFLCFSGHKIHGPKGIGALYVKNKTTLSTYMHGGGQELGLRSGTLNVPGIIGLGAASNLCKNEMNENAYRIGFLRDKLERAILVIPDTIVNGDLKNRVYNVTNICFKGNDAYMMMGRLKHVAVSNGSACTSSVIEPSHVLTAMGLTDEDAFASIRFSLGKFNTEDEIDTAIKNITELYTC